MIRKPCVCSENQRDALEETRNLFVLGAYLEIEANFWTFPTSFSFWPSAARLGWLESMRAARIDWLPPVAPLKVLQCGGRTRFNGATV